MLAPCQFRGRPMHQLTMSERRARNRSLSSLLCTPPPYPGYSACLGSIERTNTGPFFVPYGERLELPTPTSPDKNKQAEVAPPPQMSQSAYIIKAEIFELDMPRKTELGGRSPPLVSPEDDSEILMDSYENGKKKASTSSGYGSAGETSDPDSPQQMNLMTESYTVLERSSRSAKYKNRADRENEKWRRRSVPASLRHALPDDLALVLSADGQVNLSTDLGSGMTDVELRGMRRPESVMQLARRFGEIGAAQQNELHKSKTSLYDGKENNTLSKSGPPTPIKQLHPVASLGGIESLRSASAKMSRPNMFKQMEKVGSGTAVSTRTMNPNSIKDALLRWVQNRVNAYPNVNVTNFSSSWADGVAFCALAHRFSPHAFDFNMVDPKNRRANFELAFRVADENGVCPLLEVDDMIMMGDRPDWKCVFTYVQSFYAKYRDRP